MKRIIRVFPRRTKATPTDDLVRVGVGPGFFDVADEVHVSAAFTWDLKEAERLAKLWEAVAPVKMGGPAFGEPGGDFTPGQYLKHGYVITSRGCPNDCWFCSVWKREGQEVRELPIEHGYNVLDDNLLACSAEHIRAVFAMLSKQRRVEFTGGLEAARLQEWMAQALYELKPRQIFFAYDTPDDLPPLKRAGEMLQAAGFAIHPHMHTLRCYVLCGWPKSRNRPKDTLDAAEKRMAEAMAAGFTPMAMVWRNNRGERAPEWAPFQRRWARPGIIYARSNGKQSAEQQPALL